MPPARLWNLLSSQLPALHVLHSVGFPAALGAHHCPITASLLPPCLGSQHSSKQPQPCPAAPFTLSTVPRPLLPTNPTSTFTFKDFPRALLNPGPPSPQLPAQHPSSYSKHSCIREASRLQACCWVHQHPLGMRRNSHSASQHLAPKSGSQEPVDKTNSSRPERNLRK